MSNTTTSPNMLLPVPVPSVDPGPDWALNIDACLSIIDQHNHSPGSGVQITPAGLNISSDLAYQSNNAINLRSTRFTPQAAPLSLASDIGTLYVSGVDLYYNDAAGNQVRITQSGSVTGAAGTITGLPSGTASASYSGGTFTFQSATATPANFSTGPLTIGLNTASSKTITISPTSGQAANYNLFLPAASPTANQVLVSDGSGNFTWTRGLLPLGSVIATFPNLTGAYSTANTTAADANGFVLCAGQTISDASSPMNTAVVPNINSSVFIAGYTVAGNSGGAQTSSVLLAHTHTFTSSTTVATSNHTHYFAHNHQWGYGAASGGSMYSVTTPDTAIASFTTGSETGIALAATAPQSGSGAVAAKIQANAPYYTSGVYSSAGGGSGSTATTGVPNDAGTLVSGTTNSTGTGSSFSIIPPYITAVYLMRIK